jgi:hypothetical protein
MMSESDETEQKLKMTTTIIFIRYFRQKKKS